VGSQSTDSVAAPLRRSCPDIEIQIADRRRYPWRDLGVEDSDSSNVIKGLLRVLQYEIEKAERYFCWSSKLNPRSVDLLFFGNLDLEGTIRV
jgi:hypothetical protein